MSPSDPRQVHRHFRAVIARGLVRAEQEEQAHLAALKALLLRPLSEAADFAVIPVMAPPRSWPSPRGPLARERAVAVRKRKRVVTVGRLVPTRRTD